MDGDVPESERAHGAALVVTPALAAGASVWLAIMVLDLMAWLAMLGLGALLWKLVTF